MSEIEILRRRLSETGLYDCIEGTLVYAELMAYAEGLDIYFNELKKLEKEAFPASAENEGLELFERLYGVPLYDITAEGRRKSIDTLLSITDKSFTLNEMEKLPAVYGLHGTVSDSAGSIVYRIEENLSADDKAIVVADMNRFAPVLTQITIS